MEGPRRPACHDGLPHEPQPRELEEERERHRGGQHTHCVAVEDRGKAGEGSQAHELEGELPAHALPVVPERAARERGKDEEETAEPRLARHHLRRGEACGVGELVGRGHRAVADAAHKDLERRLGLSRARGSCPGCLLLDCARSCHHATFRLLSRRRTSRASVSGSRKVGLVRSSGGACDACRQDEKATQPTTRLRGEKVASAQKSPRGFRRGQNTTTGEMPSRKAEERSESLSAASLGVERQPARGARLGLPTLPRARRTCGTANLPSAAPGLPRIASRCHMPR